MTDDVLAIANARFLEDRVKDVKKQFREFGIGRQNLIMLLDEAFTVQVKRFLTHRIRKDGVSN